MAEEIWKDVVGYEGYYLVSNLGRIYSCRKGIILKPPLHHGYYAITLTNGAGKRTTLKIHRLVCESFNGPCPDGYVCRHLDGKSTNNIPSNLTWGTHLENQQDRKSHGTDSIGVKHGRSRLTEKEVKEIYRRSILGETRASLAREFSVSEATVYYIANKKTWTHIL